MARRPRHIQTGQLYEMVFRAKQGIPLPCTDYMTTLVTSRLANALKKKGISLCHFAFIGTHAHILFVPRCKSRLRNFGAQLKSSLTRVVKRVLGFEASKSLLLWDGRSTIMQILDIDMAKDRIVYLYCNPASANLVNSISEYPGANSWHAYMEAGSCLDAQVELQCPFVPEKSIDPIGKKKAHEYNEMLADKAEGKVTLALQPHIWMATFGVERSEDVEAIHQNIMQRISGCEQHLLEERKEKGRRVMSKSLLINQRPSITGRVPEKKERRIYFLSSCEELRLEFIDYFKGFCMTCRNLYEEWKEGQFPKTAWPPEAYIPQSP